MGEAMRMWGVLYSGCTVSLSNKIDSRVFRPLSSPPAAAAGPAAYLAGGCPCQGRRGGGGGGWACVPDGRQGFQQKPPGVSVGMPKTSACLQMASFVPSTIRTSPTKMHHSGARARKRTPSFFGWKPSSLR